MKILFAGTPNIAVTVLGGLMNLGHEIVGVLTREDAPSGRKRELTASPVAEYAQRHGLKVIKSNRLSAPDHVEISRLGADLAIVVAYGAILKTEALELLKEGWFNLHFSLLPEYRGAAPVQHAILQGKTETGVTLFKIDEGLDTGDIVGQVETKIEPDEDAGILLQRLAHLGITLLSEKLPMIYSGMHELITQSGDATFAPKLTRDKAKIDFAQDSATVHNLVRAMNPEPVAWTTADGESVRVIEVRPVAGNSALKPGSIIRTDAQPAVVCNRGELLELVRVQPAGKKVMSGADWIRGQQKLEHFD